MRRIGTLRSRNDFKLTDVDSVVYTDILMIPWESYGAVSHNTITFSDIGFLSLEEQALIYFTVRIANHRVLHSLF